MNRKDIDIMWNKALQQSIKDGEEFTRYHFHALVAAAAIKDAPDYKMGYADGAAAEREACAKVCDNIAANHSLHDSNVSAGAAEDCAELIRARGQE